MREIHGPAQHFFRWDRAKPAVVIGIDVSLFLHSSGLELFLELFLVLFLVLFLGGGLFCASKIEAKGDSSILAPRFHSTSEPRTKLTGAGDKSTRTRVLQ